MSFNKCLWRLIKNTSQLKGEFFYCMPCHFSTISHYKKQLRNSPTLKLNKVFECKEKRKKRKGRKEEIIHSPLPVLFSFHSSIYISFHSIRTPQKEESFFSGILIHYSPIRAREKKALIITSYFHCRRWFNKCTFLVASIWL